MKKQNLQFYPKMLLRTPLLPFQYFSEDPEKVLDKKEFKEAIFLASPDLYQELYTKEGPRDAKLATTIYKYLSRITTRCTPFGLFAGVNLMDWGARTEVTLKSSPDIKRITSLDMLFVCVLGQHLENNKTLRKMLSYYPNSSYYVQGNEIRYAEYYYTDNDRTFIISSIEKNDYLLEVLQRCEKGCQVEDIASYLKGEGFSDAEVYPYIDQLIDAQIIVSELEPSITGKDYLNDIVRAIDRLEGKDDYLESVKSILVEAKAGLAEMDEAQINDAGAYEKIYTLLKGLGLSIDKNKLFQVDSFKELDEKSMLCDKMQGKILECVDFLGKLQVKGTTNIDRFVNKFYEQYEDREVPLLTALDTDLGLGYPIENLSRDISPLIKGIAKQQPPTYKLEMGRVEVLLARILEKERGNPVVDLSKYKAELLEGKEQQSNIPPSISCKITLPDEETIILDNCGGISAGILSSRFASEGDELHKVLRELTAHDQKVLPGFDLCEILHLPESRTGNILKHPRLYDKEIPYLAKSTSEGDDKINLRDLYISARHGKIYIRNAKTDRYILPRLSNAHNHALSNQPVYRFLCDYQFQDYISYFGLSMGRLKALYSYLPRITYKNVVLQKASWSLHKNEIAALAKALDKQTDLVAAFGKWNEAYGLPQLFTAAQGDNYVLFDGQDESSLQRFAFYLKKQKNLVLNEFIFDPEKCPIKDEKGRTYFNEIQTFILNPKTPNRKPPWKPVVKQTDRYFSLGQDWVYFKVYIGTKTADKILTETIQPIAKKLLKEAVVDKWFFLRYADPAPHLRIRFRVTDLSGILQVIKAMNEAIQPFVDNNLISKFQTDIYKREIERYGGEETMESSETLFSVDSNAALKLIHLVQYSQDENVRWKLAIAATDQLANSFKLNLEDKKILFESLKVRFEREFKISRPTRKMIEKRYKLYQGELKSLIDQSNTAQVFGYAYDIFQQKQAELAPIVEAIAAVKTKPQQIDLLESYIHMLLNRLFISEPRLHELMTYYFLSRHYTSEYFRQKNKVKQHV